MNVSFSTGRVDDILSSTFALGEPRVSAGCFGSPAEIFPLLQAAPMI